MKCSVCRLYDVCIQKFATGALPSNKYLFEFRLYSMVVEVGLSKCVSIQEARPGTRTRYLYGLVDGFVRVLFLHDDWVVLVHDSPSVLCLYFIVLSNRVHLLVWRSLEEGIYKLEEG